MYTIKQKLLGRPGLVGTPAKFLFAGDKLVGVMKSRPKKNVFGKRQRPVLLHRVSGTMQEFQFGKAYSCHSEEHAIKVFETKYKGA